MEKNLVPAPIDNKNLMEDAFEDDNEIFGYFYAAKDHRKNGVRHLIDIYKSPDSEGFVDVKWKYGGNTITITLIAVPPSEDFEYVKERIFDYFKKQFKSWECEDNPGLAVRFDSEDDSLFVHFYFDLDKC
jgi:hypothetical protein